jgi:redox-sensitive bicupin YhaK (pirin superfamily)
VSYLPSEEPLPTASQGAIDLVLEARPRDLGGGFLVGRLLPSARRRMVGPFIFLDHMGPVVIEPGAAADVRPQPHKGLSTVTYLFEGENVHRDSLGTVQPVRPGDLNIMTAGRGIVHSERLDPERRAIGGAFHGVQIWVALPAENEDDAPSFMHYPAGILPELDQLGVRGRVLIGNAFGVTSPVVHPSKPVMIDLEIERGGCIDIPVSVEERGVYVVVGSIQLDDREIARDQLAVLKPGEPARIEGVEPSRVIVIGGPNIGPRVIDWNFVATTQDRIDRAREAWRAQTFPKIPGDDQEFIPLPR